MNWNYLTPEQRALHLKNIYYDNTSLSWNESTEAANIFVGEIISMLPLSSENELQIIYWGQVLEILKPTT